MTDCLFCRIEAQELPAERLFEDDDILAIRDVNPQAPTHVLIIPREHITSAADLTPGQHPLWGRMLSVAQSLAENVGADRDGYRLVINVGAAGGQTVEHLHLHLLAGRQMSWPPG